MMPACRRRPALLAVMTSQNIIHRWVNGNDAPCLFGPSSADRTALPAASRPSGTSRTSYPHRSPSSTPPSWQTDRAPLLDHNVERARNGWATHVRTVPMVLARERGHTLEWHRRECLGYTSSPSGGSPGICRTWSSGAVRACPGRLTRPPVPEAAVLLSDPPQR